MKESHRKDLASHPDPESCGGGRKATGEALTMSHAGQPSSCEIMKPGVPTLLSRAEGNTTGGDIGEPSADPAQSKTLRMRGNLLHGNREVPPMVRRVDRRRSLTARPALTPAGSRTVDKFVKKLPLRCRFDECKQLFQSRGFHRLRQMMIESSLQGPPLVLFLPPSRQSDQGQAISPAQSHPVCDVVAVHPG